MPEGGGDRRQAFAVSGFALAVYLIIVGVLLVDAGGRVAAFVHFGSESAPLPLAHQVLGDDLYVSSIQGHDGANFWVLARDPLLIDPAAANAGVTNPATRMGRILYPLLAAPWRLGGERALLWGLVITNLALLALGTYGAARLAQSFGASARGGLAYAANPAVFFGLAMDLSEVALVAALVWFVLFVRRRQFGPAIAMALAAGLAKESTLVVVLAVACLAPGLPRRFRIACPAVAIAAYGAWSTYVRLRAPGDGTSVRAFDPVPLRGLTDLARNGWIAEHDWPAMAFGLLFVVVAVIIVVRAVRRRTLLMVAALPMALVVPFYVSAVLRQPEDAARALGGSVTFLALDLFVARTTRASAGPARSGTLDPTRSGAVAAT